MLKEVEMQGYVQRVRECRGARLEYRRMYKGDENAKDGTGKNALQGKGRSTDSTS